MNAEVVLPLPLDETFTYRIPPHLAGAIEAGSRVLVPFGPRRLTGLVVSVAREVSDVDGLKEVIDVLVPSFTPDMTRLVQWIAEYYVCTLGEVVRAVLPPGDVSGGRRASVKYEKHVRFAPRYRHGVAVEELLGDLKGTKQRAVVESLAGFRSEGRPEPSRADVLARADAPSSTIQTLLARGIVELIDREVVRSPLHAIDDGPPADHTLNAGQQAALDGVTAAVDAGSFQTFLLHGVTGSGKTEVYIRALRRTLELGRRGIVLVPEIALTPQTVRRFRAHFGDRIAVFHSRMSPGERFDAWRLLRDGRYDVVIGPRSAVLLPISNVGLIVVDEEHDPSYKQQDPAPRYHARDVAVMRAYVNEAVCVLGSATPSLESYSNARHGKYVLLSMPERVPIPDRDAAALPHVRILDLRSSGGERSISPSLEKAISLRLDRREQVILLQNRRGYAPLLECRSCGWSPECPACSVTLTLHKSKRHLRCHYCGRTGRIPETCPACQGEEIERLGTGTQKVEEELQDLFPSARILRMDLDTTRQKNAHDELLRRFGEGRADVLLGTQMVAKGLDFGRVTLVGVINADVGMLLPDFRAEERTFQLLSQVAGRAGRASLPGEVIIQTRNPARPIIRYARDHDYEEFAKAVLAERRHHRYPPFGRMAGVEFKGPDETRTATMAKDWTEELRSRAGHLEILGPEQAFISRIKRQFRYHTIVKAGRTNLQQVLRQTYDAFGTPPRGYRVNVDVDPVGLF